MGTLLLHPHGAVRVKTLKMPLFARLLKEGTGLGGVLEGCLGHGLVSDGASCVPCKIETFCDPASLPESFPVAVTRDLAMLNHRAAHLLALGSALICCRPHIVG